MLVYRNWQGTAFDKYRLIEGKFVSDYFIDCHKSPKFSEAVHKREKEKFDNYIKKQKGA